MFQWIKNFVRPESRAITYATGSAAGLIQQPGYSGMVVTEQTALGISALWCGIKVISEAVGSLPPTLYQKSTNGRLEKAENHPLFPLLYSEPNPEATRPVVWETAQAHALLYGNGYLEIERDNGGRPVAIWNIHPHFVQVARDSTTGKLVYRVTNSTSGGPPGTPGQVTILQAENVLHVPGLSPNGTVGYQLLQVARDTLGFQLAAARFGCSLFRNMGRPAGVIDVPPTVKLNEDGEANLRRSFSQEHSGENVGTVAVMQQGLKFTPLTLATNEQVQYQQLMQFFVYEVARLLNCPASKLQSLEKASWGNLETLNRDFLDTTLRPWLEKWEAELERKLLMPSEKGRYFVEFDTAELLRADKLTRYQTYSTALQGAPFRTVNEVRADENLPPIDGGDVLPNSTPPAPPQPADDNAEQPADEGEDVTDTSTDKGADDGDTN
jgi:HK97 family phage portal protein